MATALNSPVESSILELICERLESWRTVLHVHYSSFSELVEVEKQIHIAYNKVANNLGTALPQERLAATSPGGARNSHAWLGPLQTYALRCSTDGETFGRFLRETVLLQLEKLRDELKTKGKDIKVRMAEIQGRLGKQHEALNTVMLTHEKGWKVRTRITPKGGEDEALAEALSVTDIFVTEQQLRHRIVLYLEEKRRYCTVLIEIFTKMRQLEHDLATALKGILGEAMRVKGQQLAAAAEQVSDCATVTRTSDALVEWNNALKRCRLDWEWQVEAPPVDGFFASALTQIGCSLSTSEMVPTVCAVDVIKSGFLMRPSTFGRSWNVMYCILTDSGFLHCYSPEFAGAISDEQRKLYRFPTSTMRLHIKALTELNQSAAKIWLTFDDPNTDVTQALIQPILSIPLLHPETSIVPDPKTGSHAFAITVPGGTSFFSRSERRHVLCSFVEEDMVDWCIALKDQLGGAPVEISRPSSVVSAEVKTSRTEEFNAFGASVSTHYSTDQNENEGGGEEDDIVYRKRYDPPILRSSTPTTPIEELENPWD